MKTLITLPTLIRSLGIVIIALTLNSCGAFYPYAYYYNGDNSYAYRQPVQERGTNYSAYFSQKAQEYGEVLGEGELVVQEQLPQNANANDKVNVQLVIDATPNYNSYSWGFRPYWDPYYAYSPFMSYGFYDAYFYDQWYWRYSSSFYNWGYASWWNPYGGLAYFYYPHHYHYNSRYYYTPSRNRGRSNHSRSSYRSSRILGYNSSGTYASTSRGRTSALRSLNNTGRTSLRNSTRNLGRDNSTIEMRSNRTRINSYRNNSRTRTIRSSNIRTRTNATPRRTYTRPSSNSRRKSFSTPARRTIRYNSPKRSRTIKRSSSNGRSNNSAVIRRSSTPIKRSSIRRSRPSVSRATSVRRSAPTRSSSTRSSSSRKRN